MRITQLLTDLADAGCRLIPDGAALRVQNPEHRLTDALRQQIRQHKPALLAALNEASGQWHETQVYDCPVCGGTYWGPKPNNPTTWWCLACHPADVPPYTNLEERS